MNYRHLTVDELVRHIGAQVGNDLELEGELVRRGQGTCVSDDRTGAVLSDCGRYRYRLWRRWNWELQRLAFIMLNPSTADAAVNDQTIRKCIGFAKALNCGGIEVVNLFAWRATKPRDLFRAAEPVGPANDRHITAVALSVRDEGGMVLCAWGSNAKRHPRVKQVCETLFMDVGESMHALRINGDGTPAHPLMLPFSCKPVEFAL